MFSAFCVFFSGFVYGVQPRFVYIYISLLLSLIHRLDIRLLPFGLCILFFISSLRIPSRCLVVCLACLCRPDVVPRAGHIITGQVVNSKQQPCPLANRPVPLAFVFLGFSCFFSLYLHVSFRFSLFCFFTLRVCFLNNLIFFLFRMYM